MSAELLSEEILLSCRPRRESTRLARSLSRPSSRHSKSSCQGTLFHYMLLYSCVSGFQQEQVVVCELICVLSAQLVSMSMLLVSDFEYGC